MSADEEHAGCESCAARDELADIADNMMGEALERLQYAARLRTLADVLSDEEAIDLARQFREPTLVVNTVGGDA